MLRLFICEKPSQAKDIANFLKAGQRGNGYYQGGDCAVTWCIGHLLEQSKPEIYNPALKSWDLKLLPVVPTAWQLVVKDSVKAQYSIVATLLKKSSEVVIATDADREGEVIAREVMDLAGYRGKVSRLWLSALDDASIKKAFGKLLPGEKTLTLYYSGLGRARADWLAGMNLTMAMTTAFGARQGVLHIGRVQTPTLALVVRRCREIANFKPKTHYDLGVVFRLANTPVPMRWVKPQTALDKDGHIVDAVIVEKVASALKGATGKVESVETVEKQEAAPLLFSLGTLQRAANAIYGMKAQAVLDIAQSLYEKHKATSYPRTDCEYLPNSMFAEVGTVLAALQTIDTSLAPALKRLHDGLAKPGRAFNDKKVTAHHAIIPTTNARVNLAAMSEVEKKVYRLIRARYLMQFAGDFQYLQTEVKVSCQQQAFVARGKAPTKQGWKLFQEEPGTKKEDDEQGDGETTLPIGIAAGQHAPVVSAEVKKLATKPPKLYTEGTLLAAMDSVDKLIDDPRLRTVMQKKEKAGIGTDATRAGIIENLFKREYLQYKGKTLIAGERGEKLITLVEKITPELADPVLTALWEEQLSRIEAGEVTLSAFEGGMSGWLKKNIDTIRQSAPPPPPPPRTATKNTAAILRPAPSTAKAHTEGAGQEGTTCPSCGKGTLVRRTVKATGLPFFGCTNFREGCKCFIKIPSNE